MAKDLRLSNFPNVLRTYSTHLPRTAPTGHCFVCWRDYGTKTDPHDFGEIPCHALQLQPCGHYVGSQCFKVLCRSGMSQCQLCRQPIHVLSDPIPKYMQRIVGSPWFDTISKCAGQQEWDHNIPRHNALLWDLFRGGLSVRQAIELWLNFARPLWVGTCKSGVARIIGVQIASGIVEWLFDVQYFELALLKAVLGSWVPCTWRLLAIVLDVASFLGLCLQFDGVLRRGRRYGEILKFWACCFSFWRAITLLLTWKGCLVLLLGNCLSYSVTAAVLIAYGVRQRRRN
ncbi:hypothetical protein K505DRAFT_359831 [Melanomma pulvis-pyrius CBS 109.77]|uniref:Uncharacterized protein n=1 Tax=Melanomma pulvis-pyrius CBS 109.77 TaxID=1314802 RepID=A0A6A6XJW9_9PLEO|nr:hypothetical protein K505DRAFT_359831 [Melanomma pulvis-pyrius CBS 109.77]